MRSIVSLFIALALVTTTGCSMSNSSGSLSDSSGSLSDSIKSISTSISDSSESSSGDDSGGGDNEAPAPESAEDTNSYRKDVSQLAATYIERGGELAAFTSAISNLARVRGITDWEADSETAQAIGVGAGNAGLGEAAFDDFGRELFGDNLTKLNELRIGYQQSAASAPSDPSTPSVAAPAAESTSLSEARPDAS